MGFRFRKSLSPLKGIRFTLSKSGLNVSAGVKGARVGVGSKGAYTSVGVPGTGISSVNYMGKGKKQTQDATSQKSKGNALFGFLFLAAIIVAFIQPAVGMLLIFALLVVGYLKNKKAKRAKVDAEA